MERNSAPGWRHGDESYRRKLHSRRGNDDDAKTKGACDFLLPIQTSQKMVSTDDGWLLFSTTKNPKGSLPLTRNHTFSSAACLRVFFVFVLSWTMRCNLAVPLDFPVSYFLFFLIPICANLATLETQYLSHHLRNFSLDKWRRNVKQIKVTPYQRLQRCRVELNIAATFRKKNKKNWETNIKTMWRKTSPSHFLFINSWINNHFGNIKLKMRNLDLIKNKLLIHQTVDTFNVYDPLWIFFLFCFFQMI